MSLEHWNPPRVAVVLLQNEKLRLSNQNGQTRWRFPEAALETRDRTPYRAAERIMESKFKVHIVTVGIIDARAEDVGEHSGVLTLYVLARMMEDKTSPLPGLTMRGYGKPQLKEMSDDDKLAGDVLPIYEMAKAMLKAEEAR